jgi:hypothetical protein
MRKIYVIGFALLAVINLLVLGYLGYSVLSNPAYGARYLTVPAILIALVSGGIAVILSTVSSIAFYKESASAYKIGLGTALFGLLVALYNINIFGTLFYGALSFEMWQRRNFGHK